MIPLLSIGSISLEKFLNAFPILSNWIMSFGAFNSISTHWNYKLSIWIGDCSDNFDLYQIGVLGHPIPWGVFVCVFLVGFYFMLNYFDIFYVMEGNSLDDKLAKKIDEIKTAMSQIMTAQNDWVHQTKLPCTICQQIEPSNQKPLELLVPLPLLEVIWEDLSMDFIIHLPIVKSKSVVVVVVDRLSKYCHLGSFSSNYTASTMVDFFVEHIIKLHGMPKMIRSDRDRVFMGSFWKGLLQRNGTKLQYSAAYHPQTKGQTEVINKLIAMYLCGVIHDRPKLWLEALPWV